MNTILFSDISVGRRFLGAVIECRSFAFSVSGGEVRGEVVPTAPPIGSGARLRPRLPSLVLRHVCLLATIVLGACPLRAADPIDAVLTGGIHPTAKRVEKDYVFAPSAANQQTYLYVYNTETNYFPTQRLDTVTWSIEGPTLGLKVTTLSTNAAGTEASAVLEPAGTFEDIKSGVLKLTATDVNSVKKTVNLSIETTTSGTSKTCLGGNCGGKTPAEAPLADAFLTRITDPIVKITSPITTTPIISPNPSGPYYGSQVCTYQPPGTTQPPGATGVPPSGGGEEEIQSTLFTVQTWKLLDNELGDALIAPRSVGLDVTLGRCDFGKSAGALNLNETYPTNLLSTPTCLNYVWPTNYDCQVLTNGAGIRQVKVPEGLADISTNTAYKYSINIFPTHSHPTGF